MKTVMTACVVAIVLSTACAKKDDAPQPATPQPATSGYPQGQYPAQQYPQGGQQTYTPQGAPTPMTTAPMATAPGAAPAGAMATPGPLALPCQNDTSCGLAHCNVQFSKCAFPCAGPADCITGAACNTATGLCLPAAK